MGREAQVRCDVGTQTDTVKALLESDMLILRGTSIRLQWPTTQLSRVRVDHDALGFETPAGDAAWLHLGSADAHRWLRKMLAPAPTLASKLGISPAQPAAVYGRVDDEALAEALQAAVTTDPAAATVLVAVLRSDADLTAAAQQHADMPCRGMWVVHEKGPHASLPSPTIRETLRAQGYKDHKIAGISVRWTATRYAKPTA